MPVYIVKEGATAYLDNALRGPGYRHQREKAYKGHPSWAEPLGAKAKTAAAKKSTAADAKKAKAAQSSAEVTFAEETLTTGQTVQL